MAQTTGSDSEVETPVIEKWGILINAIMDTTKKAAVASPPFDESQPSVFQGYWRNVFVQLRESISADTSVPKYLTDPPTKIFSILLFDATHALGCPCCLPFAKPNIHIENDDGVTKENLLEGFVGYMYGDSLPHVYSEAEDSDSEEEEEGEGKDDASGAVEQKNDQDTSTEAKNDVEDEESSDDDSDADAEEDKSDDEDKEYVPQYEAVPYTDNEGILVYSADWMSGPGGSEGVKVVYGPERPEIWLYCCGLDEYLAKKKLKVEDALERLDIGQGEK